MFQDGQGEAVADLRAKDGALGRPAHRPVQSLQARGLIAQQEGRAHIERNRTERYCRNTEIHIAKCGAPVAITYLEQADVLTKLIQSIQAMLVRVAALEAACAAKAASAPSHESAGQYLSSIRYYVAELTAIATRLAESREQERVETTKPGFVPTNRHIHLRLGKALNDGREAIKIIALHSRQINRILYHDQHNKIEEAKYRYLAADNCIRLSQRCIVKGTRELHDKFFRRCLTYVDQHSGGTCHCSDHGVNLDTPIPYVRRVMHRMHRPGSAGPNSNVTRTTGNLFFPGGVYRSHPTQEQRQEGGSYLYDMREEVELELNNDVPWP
jgi:hypothetical protein